MKSDEIAKKLAKKLGLNFNDEKRLVEALTHRSYLNEHRQKSTFSNERLEFLGDAVLELWVTKKLFETFPGKNEGVLTNVRAALVRTEGLAETAKGLAIGGFLLLSKGEDDGGGRENLSLLADTFEAIIGAIYLDLGWEETDKFLAKTILDKLITLGKQEEIKDAKTKLQEIAQAKLKITPYYKIVEEEGPDHAKMFTAAVYFDQKEVATGTGLSKKEAEEKAAGKALTLSRII